MNPIEEILQDERVTVRKAGHARQRRNLRSVLDAEGSAGH